MASPLQEHLDLVAPPAHLAASDALGERLLGATPIFSRLAHWSPLAMGLYHAAVRPCLRIPLCDAGVASLGPHHRRRALMESSLQHRLPYCVAHCATIGDLFRGNRMLQQREPQDDSWPGEDVLVAVVKDACAVPARMQQHRVTAFVGLFGQRAWEELQSMIMFMAFLNFANNALTVQVEEQLIPFARRALQDGGVSSELIPDEVAGQEQSDHRGGRWAQFTGLLRVVPSLVRATMQELNMYAGVPLHAAGVEECVLDEIGMLPRFIAGVHELVCKRTLAMSARAVLAEKNASWSRGEKAMLMGVFARGVGNEVLFEDAEAILGGVEIGLGVRLEVVLQEAGRFGAASRYVQACAGPHGAVTDEIQANLVQCVNGRKDITDLVGMVGFFAMAHRALIMSFAR